VGRRSQAHRFQAQACPPESPTAAPSPRCPAGSN
jgi:hypothetical protein